MNTGDSRSVASGGPSCGTSRCSSQKATPAETEAIIGSGQRRTTWQRESQRPLWSARWPKRLNLPTSRSAAFFDLLAETAVKETKKNGEFTIPGIGKLVKAERKARLGRNPQTGEAIKIKAKTVVKFRVAKVAKDTIAPVKK